MNNILRSAALAATSMLVATPALAAPVAATTPATAKVTIVRSLTLTANQNLDLGTVVIGTSIAGTETVSLANTGGPVTCGSTSALTCSGTAAVAKYTVTGAASQNVKITTTAANLADAGGDLLLFTPNAHADVVLASVSGVGTATFDLGGSVDVSGATKDGVYVGNMNVTVDYN